ncbi:MAG: phage tail sheath subtilisin-like domain-containing protein [Verrucomicrobiota bacterium]|nr:phage tail sheath subtilisin-like domain-containing protein [Verrucomicrobiota bacterium]
MSDLIRGIEAVLVDSGGRPIKQARASVIGLVGTAPEAGDSGAYAFPINTPVLVTTAKQALQRIYNDVDGEGVDGGSLLDALEGIFAHANSLVVMTRVAEGVTPAATATAVAGSSSARTGVYALLNAESVTGVKPKIIIAPGISTFTTGPVAATAVPAALLAVAARLKGYAIIEGPNTTNADAISAHALPSGSRENGYFIDPYVTVGTATLPASGYIAGLDVLNASERGWWTAFDNRGINAITGTARPIDFAWGDAACDADVLAGEHINTIIRSDGFRAWGNRTMNKTDPRFLFLTSLKINNQIMESILISHRWLIGQGITRNLGVNVVNSVNTYLRSLVSNQAIYGGSCWLDPELNTEAEIALGHAYWDYDFTDVKTLERATFRAHMVNDYISNIFETA